MKKFQFRLATLERVRRNQELACMRLLAEAQQKLIAGKEIKFKLVETLNQSLIRRENLGNEPIPSSVFKVENDFIVGLKQRIIQADQAILRATRAVEKSLRTFLQARRQTRTLEILREKEHAEFKKDLIKQENKKLDELYTTRFRLQQEEGL